MGQAWRVDQPVLTKGKLVAVEGSMRQDKWEQDGQTRSKTSFRPIPSNFSGRRGAGQARRVLSSYERPQGKPQAESQAPKPGSEPAATATILPTTFRSDRLYKEKITCQISESRWIPGHHARITTGDPSPGRTERIADRAVPPRQGLLQEESVKFCTQKLKVDYKDIDVMRRFVTERGKILPRPDHRHLRQASARARGRHQAGEGIGLSSRMSPNKGS